MQLSTSSRCARAMDVGDTSTLRLSPADAVDGVTPLWSPDGAQIAYESLRRGSWEIMLMNSDGGDVSALTQNNTGDRNATRRP